VYFTPSECFVQDHTSQKLIEIGHRQGGLYVLNHLKELIVIVSNMDLSLFCLSSSFSPFYLWHSRWGHVSVSRLKFLASMGVVGTLDNYDIFDCSGCKLAKYFTLPFNKRFLLLLLLLVLCILMCKDLLLYPPK